MYAAKCGAAKSAGVSDGAFSNPRCESDYRDEWNYQPVGSLKFIWF